MGGSGHARGIHERRLPVGGGDVRVRHIRIRHCYGYPHRHTDWNWDGDWDHLLNSLIDDSVDRDLNYLLNHLWYHLLCDDFDRNFHNLQPFHWDGDGTRNFDGDHTFNHALNDALDRYFDDLVHESLDMYNLLDDFYNRDLYKSLLHLDHRYWNLNWENFLNSQLNHLWQRHGYNGRCTHVFICRRM